MSKSKAFLLETNVVSSPRITDDVIVKIRSKFPNNYFGLPPYSMQQTPDALAYQCRKAVEFKLLEDEGDSRIRPIQENERSEIGSRKNLESTHNQQSLNNVAAQRKVASALLTMVSNPLMMKHFLFKGGFEAVLRLVNDCSDYEVLLNCSQCLTTIASEESYVKHLIEKGILSGINRLLDCDESIKYMASVIVARLTYPEEIEEILLLNGLMSVLQVLFSHVHRTDTLCLLLLSFCNIAPAINGADAELIIRLCFQGTKKIDVVRSLQKAIFIADLYNNFSRISSFSSLLVDEGVLPLMLHIIDSHPIEEILRRTSETLANLSINRKNRREIASSGIASRLAILFENGSPATKSFTLLIIGNLLSSGLFYDKVANSPTITNILDNLLDLNFPKQFTAVSFCLCQLSKIQQSCEVLIDCSVVPIVLGYIRQAPLDSIDYLWTVLVNISQFNDFFEKIISHSKVLVMELYEETRFDSSTAHQQLCVAKIAQNLSKHVEFKDYLDDSSVDLFVKTLKTLFSSRRSSRDIQISALLSLTHFANYCTSSRSYILSNDLIELFYEAGTEDTGLNVKYVGLLNIISNEESCCYKLLELGVQKFLVSLQDGFQKMTDGASLEKKQKKLLRAQSSHANRPLTASKSQPEEIENDPVIEGELGKAHTAAIIHNLALKRPILSPGVLTMMLSLAKNCKALRVLHCIRALANMSVHSKSKLAISKESKKIFPMLTVIMRCGCEEAERVQYYCAVVLCNILALSLDKTLLQDLVKSGAVGDLIVVTLLRINAIKTKEILGKAFFNLLSRSEIRENLILQVDILSAVLELSKIEYVDLLELCIRALYNISCELTGPSGSEYASKLTQLKVAAMMIQRLIYSPDIAGSMTTRSIRLLLGMAIANMSFHKMLVLEIAKCESKIADALYRVHVLGSEEATYCAISTLYNLSRIPECKVLADSKALLLLVEVLESNTSAVCIKLCVAVLCNFSKLLVFHEQLTNLAIKPLINVILSPSLHVSVKKDAVQACYNLATLFPPSRVSLIQHETVSALWKLVKISGTGAGRSETKETAQQLDVEDDGSEESLIILIGRLVKELTEDVSDLLILRKLLSDGIMGIILKLAKVEIVDLKVTMSFALYYLSRGTETLKLLKRDAVDILFWLTMYDALGLNDLILRNVSRTMRSFSVGVEDCILLLKQERFFAVLKVLTKSKNEDVLWQTAGMVYNVMQVESCLKKFLERGLIGYIFELASSGFSHVKHVCSACLHMVPEHIPNMEDPLSLELVLCLLEAEGDKFSEISVKPSDSLSFPLESCNKDSSFQHTTTPFIASWAPFTCLVENFFTPALIFQPATEHNQSLSATIDPTGISATDRHKKLKSKDYEDFQHSVHQEVNGGQEFPRQNQGDSFQSDDIEWNVALDHGVTIKDMEKKPQHFIQSDNESKLNGNNAIFPDVQSRNKSGKENLKLSHSLPSISHSVPTNTVEAIKRSTVKDGQSNILPSSLSYKSFISKQTFL